MGMRARRDELEDLAFRHLMPGGLCDHPASRLAELHNKSEGLHGQVSKRSLPKALFGARHRGQGRGPPKAASIRCGARWSANRLLSNSSRIFSAFRIVVRTIERLLPRRSASFIPSGRTSPARFKDYISTSEAERLPARSIRLWSALAVSVSSFKCAPSAIGTISPATASPRMCSIRIVPVGRQGHAWTLESRAYQWPAGESISADKIHLQSQV